MDYIAQTMHIEIRQPRKLLGQDMLALCLTFRRADSSWVLSLRERPLSPTVHCTCSERALCSPPSGGEAQLASHVSNP